MQYKNRSLFKSRLYPPSLKATTADGFFLYFQKCMCTYKHPFIVQQEHTIYIFFFVMSLDKCSKSTYMEIFISFFLAS